MPANTSRLGRISTWSGRLGIVAAVLGPALAHFEIVKPLAGFGVFAFGLLLAVLCLAIGLLALLLGPSATRPASAAGLIPAVLLILAVFVAAGAGENYPRINDITTDTMRPPIFIHAVTLPENAGRNMDYPGGDFPTQQQSGYPDLAPVTLAAPPDEAFKQVAATARSMDGWHITREDPTARVVEGYDTSRLFRFKDDFIIEVRPLDGKSQVQMRSKSRDGKGDMGVNANRIRVFLARLGS
ncbi:MAG: DUF1499 domain-containing protein [Deltaproteobacteria bacterium]|nr:DUF1499 domain-containing protein [Deltaproteobacteria bacterium]